MKYFELRVSSQTKGNLILNQLTLPYVSPPILQFANHLVCIEYFAKALSNARCKLRNGNFRAVNMLASTIVKGIVAESLSAGISRGDASGKANGSLMTLKDVSTIPQFTPS